MDMGLLFLGAMGFLMFSTGTIKAFFQREGKIDILNDSFIISSAKGTNTASAEV